MRKLGPIFAGTDVQEEEMKPLYEHLDGTVEVLGFEQYGIRLNTVQASEENYVGLQESIEADIVLLEAIQGQQRLTEQQDSGVNSPDYQGLTVPSSLKIPRSSIRRKGWIIVTLRQKV